MAVRAAPQQERRPFLTIGRRVALLLNEKIQGRNLFRSFILLPWAMPAFVSFLTWRLLFLPIGGGINLLMKAVGLNVGTIDWLGQRSTAMPAGILPPGLGGFPLLFFSFPSAAQK